MVNGEILNTPKENIETPEHLRQIP